MAEQLRQAVEAEIQQILAEISESDNAVLKLRIAKSRANLAVLRARAVRNQAQFPQLRESVLQCEDKLVSIEHELAKRTKQRPDLQTNRREADDPRPQELSNKQLLDELNSLPSESQSKSESLLRNRKKPARQPDRLEVETEIQGDMSEEILDLVRAIKRNAELFAEKLDTDNTVVDAAATAVSRAATKLDTVGTTLRKYTSSSALGWWFYIKATAFVVIALVVGMLLIQLFPKL